MRQIPSGRGRRKLLKALLGTAAGTAVGMGGESAAEATAMRVITFYGDQSIMVPQAVTRIAISWEAQNSIVTMLGYGDKIVATTPVAQKIPAFLRFVPSIKNVPLAGEGADVNVDLLISLHPDVLIVPDGFPPATRTRLERAGVVVAEFHRNSLQALLQRTLIIGQILGPDAYARAQAYESYVAYNKQRVADNLAKVPQSQRLKLYLANRPLHTSARPSLDQDWMDLGGAINVAENWKLPASHGDNTNIEAVAAVNPDVIVCMRSTDVAAICGDPQWQGIKAVNDGRVYANPRGLYWWCRETSETALQFLWIAKTLYPVAFADIDMVAETKSFYKKFYCVELSDADANDFLHPLS